MNAPGTLASSPPAGEILRVEKRGGLPAVAASPSAVDTNTIRFRVSSEDVDALGDIVLQDGLEFPATLPAVADHNHSLDASLGEWSGFERAGRETFGNLRLLPPGKSRLADLSRALHEGGFPLGSSVSFHVNRADIRPVTKIGPGGRLVETGGSIYGGRKPVFEISLTQFPANPAAVAVARSLGFNDAELAALSRPEPAAVPIARTTSAVAGANPPRGIPMTIAEMIAAAQAAHDTAQATLGTATLALESDQSEANLTAVQRATTEVESLFSRLATLRAAETAAARRAAATPSPSPAAVTPVARAVATVAADNRSAGIITRRTDTRDVPAGTRLAQLAIARCIAHTQKRNLDQVATESFAAEPEVIAIARAAVGAADTTTAGWAAELVRTETRGLLDAGLVPASIWPALSARGMSLNFAGAQSISIPMSNLGTTAGGAWVGEGGAIPLVKGNLTAKRLSRYKLGGIVPYTKELERASDPQVVTVMRELLAQTVTNLLDASLIDALPAVPEVRPAGLLNGVTPIAGAAGGGMAAVLADLTAVSTAFTAANVGSRPVLLMHPNTRLALSLMTNALGQFPFQAQVDGGSLNTTPIISSPIVPVDMVIAVDAASFASAIDSLEFDLNDSATLTMADAGAAAPTQAGAAAGGGALGVVHQVVPDGGIPIAGAVGASTTGYTAMSLWQTWSAAIRLVQPASFGVTRAGAVQIVTPISWA